MKLLNKSKATEAYEKKYYGKGKKGDSSKEKGSTKAS